MVVGRYHIPQRAGTGKVLYAFSDKIGAFVKLDGEVLLHVGSQCEKTSLGIAKRKVECGSLESMIRMQRRENHAAASVDNIFSESDSDLNDAVLRLFVAERIVIERASDSRE